MITNPRFPSSLTNIVVDSPPLPRAGSVATGARQGGGAPPRFHAAASRPAVFMPAAYASAGVCPASARCGRRWL